jgi:hypothetical protein
MKLLSFALIAVPMLPMVMGAQGDGCAANSKSPAPDVRGTWAIAYDNQIGVEVKIGGATYNAQLGAQGGAFTITHEGKPYTFDLDCSRPDVVCPGEAWPNQVAIEQRDVQLQHQMVVDLPTASCDSALTQPDPGSCGTGTNNPNCDLVCGGDITVATNEAFGVIGEDGGSFRLYLGGGVVTNGVNCAMLGYSVADATIDSTGQGTSSWDAASFSSGLVTIGYSGACLFGGTVDGTNQVLLVGAELKFTTGFTGTKQ